MVQSGGNSEGRIAMVNEFASVSNGASAELEKLRRERNLRLVQGEEEGEGIDFLPPGVYGFSYAPHTEGMPLFSKQPYQCFEVHKLHDESIHYVGYMTEEDLQAFLHADDAVDVSLYPAPHERAQKLVSVPKSRVLKGRPVSRENGNFLPLTLSAKR
ncbi:MAG: hypothetical protein NZV14_07110 [Bryobacteraceae bacterium]|nr:hypothetical protein [Bryobacteraceae bacterium]MDW8377912.1 hypothetical protein [Bryobacterales bacterium]